MMDLASFFHFLLSLDDSLLTLVQNYGSLSYLVLFAVIFLETGVIITPFLPGDSLLFAAGALASLGALNVISLCVILFIAAVLGDSLNYLIGNTWGRRIAEYAHRKNFFINYKHIAATEAFYEKHGGKAIIFARFMPIVRTFAPFVAGIGKMNYSKFAFYNICGALAWVLLLVCGGYFFGNIPIVKDNFELVILAIIVISFIPALTQLFRRSRRR